MADRQPVRDPAERLVPALQRERLRAGTLRRGHRPPVDPERLPRRALHLGQPAAVPRALRGGPAVPRRRHVPADAPGPARYLAVAFGGLRYPTLADKRATFMGMDVSVKEGGRQIEYEDEDPRIRRIYEDELRKRGIPSRMDEVFEPA